MKILLFNQREIELTLREANEIKQRLLDRSIQFIEIGNELINAKDIRGIFESEGLMPERFKLPEPQFKKISEDEHYKQMEKMFNFLKTKGMFEKYANYQEWCEKKYGKEEAQRQKQLSYL